MNTEHKELFEKELKDCFSLIEIKLILACYEIATKKETINYTEKLLKELDEAKQQTTNK